ncbi:hypothetical protein Hanom_Chr06g00567531 [Helianthus anomalus]
MDHYEGMKRMVFGWSIEWNHRVRKAFQSLKIFPSTPMFFFSFHLFLHQSSTSPQPTTFATTHHRRHRRLHPQPVTASASGATSSTTAIATICHC